MENNLKKLRIDKGLYQKDIAKMLDIAVSTYSYWESGTNEPDQKSLIKLADYYGVTTDYLLCRTNQPQIEKALGIDQEPKDRLKDVPMAFYNKLGDVANLSPEGQQDILKYIDYVKNKEGK